MVQYHRSTRRTRAQLLDLRSGMQPGPKCVLSVPRQRAADPPPRGSGRAGSYGRLAVCPQALRRASRAAPFWLAPGRALLLLGLGRVRGCLATAVPRQRVRRTPPPLPCAAPPLQHPRVEQAREGVTPLHFELSAVRARAAGVRQRAPPPPKSRARGAVSRAVCGFKTVARACARAPAGPNPRIGPYAGAPAPAPGLAVRQGLSQRCSQASLLSRVCNSAPTHAIADSRAPRPGGGAAAQA
jgi:hypothetical protein